MSDAAQSLQEAHPAALRIIEFEGGEREIAELKGYMDRGDFMPVWEIASQHGHTQAACMNAGAADALFDFAEAASDLATSIAAPSDRADREPNDAGERGAT